MGLDERIFALLEEAGQAIMEVYHDPTLLQVNWKKDNSPLTRADEVSHDILVTGMQHLYPDWIIVSEENFSARELKDPELSLILIDPLDGTKEFIKRNGEFTINIAFIEKGKPVAGYVSIPAENKIYGAAIGHGAYRMEHGQRPSRIESNSFSILDKGLRFYISRSHGDRNSSTFINQLDKPVIHELGSALKFLRLAEGNAELYVRYTPCMHWDTAAGQCILEEAGGTIMHIPSLEPLSYRNHDRINPPFLALGRLTDPEQLKQFIY